MVASCPQPGSDLANQADPPLTALLGIARHFVKNATLLMITTILRHFGRSVSSTGTVGDRSRATPSDQRESASG
jgi:hypothetical protein